MKHAVQSMAKRAAAVLLAAALALPTAYASAGTRWLTSSQTLTDGLTYVNTITQHSSAGRVESYSFQLSPDSDVYPIMVQSSGTAYGAATINKAISYAESMGYNVIGGINSDFFGNGGVPLGISIEDGIYKSSPEGNNAVATVNGQVSLSVSPQVYITLTNQRDNSTVELTHFNKWRNSSGGLYLYNEDFSTISTQTNAAGGRMVRFKVVDNGKSTDLTVNSTLTLEVVDVFETSDAVPIGEDNYILTAAYESGFYEVFASYHVGDRVTLTTSCSDSVLSNAQWASGAGDIIVRNGAITDSSQWVYGKDGRNPRTALGVKADGTLVLYEVDGRQSGYSGGLSEKDRRAASAGLPVGGQPGRRRLLHSQRPSARLGQRGRSKLSLRRIPPQLRHLYPSCHRRPRNRTCHPAGFEGGRPGGTGRLQCHLGRRGLHQ